MKTTDSHEIQLRSLLEPFVDASSSFTVREKSDGIYLAEGVRRFQSFSLRLRPKEGTDDYFELHTRHGKTEERPLSSVLSSARFGNLDALARTMISYLTRKLRMPEAVVEGQLDVYSDAPGFALDFGSRTLAFGALRTCLEFRSKSATHLSFLHGHAGSGKSWMLMFIAREQAQRFLSREADSLLLYIDAQGVNLRSLEQQVSYQLDVLNGVLRFPEVIPLVRLGCLSLVIDGFDELIMPSGYNDTLSALCSYLEAMEGQGSVLASARTAFFHTYDLQTAGIAMSRPVVQTTLEVVPWGETERRRFCEVRDIPQVVERLEAAASAQAPTAALLGRPFVVAQVADLLARGQGLDNSEVMMAIEEAFLERERTEKLLDPTSRAPLLSSDQFRSLLIEVALEMWHLRQTSIDTDSLRILASLLLEEWGLGKSVREVIAQRMELNPILQLGSGPARRPYVQFPHEILFARFLGRALLEKLGGPLAEGLSALGEAPLGESTVEQIALLLRQGDSVAFGSGAWDGDWFIAQLAGIGAKGGRRLEDANVRTNLGMLAVVGLVGRRSAEPIELARCDFAKAVFEGANLEGVTFRNCAFGEVDASQANWEGAGFTGCPVVQKFTVGRGQRFPQDLPEVAWLVLAVPGESDEWYFGDVETRAHLFPESVERPQLARPEPALSDGAIELSQAAERLARRALRVFWISLDEEDSDDRFLRSLKRAPAWARLIELLEKNGLARRSVRQRRGSNPEMIHLEMPHEILKGAHGAAGVLSPRVKKFWEDVRSVR